ncbi:rhodanese-like domain-containing protein [Pukyongia salina]|uniref:Rhodanese-like domain-containing protein n=1 Tax=Pukyongia salina TaxID=2094025 RepID=A0A2S0HWW3_9FLAO|nr:rhodanese-like domain-containing protein [Pukyongia salina]AVI51149.1 rhodanese-like domain-containing protein [Pukyongia salina]
MFFKSLLGTAAGSSSNSIRILNTSEYKAAISKGKVQLVDVRTPNEYRAGHIPNAVNIDYFQPQVFAEKVAKLDKNKAVYIYCRSGSRSRGAAAQLVKLGFTEIYDLKGGYMKWN